MTASSAQVSHVTTVPVLTASSAQVSHVTTAPIKKVNVADVGVILYLFALLSALCIPFFSSVALVLT